MKISHISRWTPLAKLDSWRHLVWLLHVEGGALSGGLPRRSEADIGCKGQVPSGRPKPVVLNVHKKLIGIGSAVIEYRKAHEDPSALGTKSSCSTSHCAAIFNSPDETQSLKDVNPTGVVYFNIETAYNVDKIRIPRLTFSLLFFGFSFSTLNISNKALNQPSHAFGSQRE